MYDNLSNTSILKLTVSLAMRVRSGLVHADLVRNELLSLVEYTTVAHRFVTKHDDEYARIVDTLVNEILARNNITPTP